MTLTTTHNDISFGVGDRVRVAQKIKEGERQRSATFEGIVIALKGSLGGKTFTVRKIGEAKIGIERIFPVDSPSIEKVDVLKKGTAGVKRAKLYYLRQKPASEAEKIFARANLRSSRK
ncbi:50S ribosomal protein L19 [Candidatus Woesebacteria bacterium GWA1_41_8]|uniref:50S ribosomal protein L19 n=1 Tax=Candidatus Woesebacteria bacterium GWA1_41_8 TaxID=1802471 RepID=A0A1F7WGG5_9BACT|nr:MAG: 50S ribosomal protein L19 [Candidatus Woesebacteria bacterium GWA1_41_8]